MLYHWDAKLKKKLLRPTKPVNLRAVVFVAHPLLLVVKKL
jgi:hypothetical protein